MNQRLFALVVFLVFISACGRGPREDSGQEPLSKHPFLWENATIYFLLTDRFYNGDPGNDYSLGRLSDGDTLRYFMGGDLKGITQKIEEGYFDDLGVNAIWMTPIFENIRGFTDEGTGKTYAYHGYWMRDWTRLDPNFGTADDLGEMLDAAHSRGIRILLDAVANHTGPVTDLDPQWPDEWVRTGPVCTYVDFASTVECTLVENLPDFRTDLMDPVDLPEFLLRKWEEEGRLEEELAELDQFFARTGYPRAPRYYLIKWLCDWVREYGIDGFRVDTAKHTEADIWDELAKEAQAALREWKDKNPARKPDDLDFWMVGEVYGYNIGSGRNYDYGDSQVDFYANGFDALINFQFKYDAKGSPEALFRSYSEALNAGELNEFTVLNYLSSHDDANPFDAFRQQPLETGTLLLLSPGAAQIYYGDETARILHVPGAKGDAHLRSFMNWEDLADNVTRDGYSIAEVHQHWQKLGAFRKKHISVGAGVHSMLQESPYVFTRRYESEDLSDVVLIGLGLPAGEKTLPAGGVFLHGTNLLDYYSGQKVQVTGEEISLDSPFSIALLGVERK